MSLSWFDTAWPWIGLAIAAVLGGLLFATDRLRGNTALPQWRDPVWIGWLVAATYMVHQFEEYGIDAGGQARAFPAAMCGVLGYLPQTCPVPPAFYLAVNLPLTWLAAPLSAVLARRLPLVGLGFVGLLVANGLTHLAPIALGKGYDAGALTAALLFLPLAAWVAWAFFWTGGMPRGDALVVVGCGALIQAILIGSLLLFMRGVIGVDLLLAIQIANAFVTPALTAAWSLSHRRLASRR